LYIDLTFRCGIPDEHFPLLQETIAESIVQTQMDKVIIAEIRMPIVLEDGKVQYQIVGQLVGADEVHITPPDEDDHGDPGYKDKKRRAKN
jgi:hypothetical protein